MIENNSLPDAFGSTGMSESIRLATQKHIAGAGAFLLRFCPGAVEEISLALRSLMSEGRAVQLTRILHKANRLLNITQPDTGDQIHPRLIQPVLEVGSWCGEEEIQNYWAGLLVSGTSPMGASDENLLFMSLLRRMSSLELKLLAYGVLNSKKRDGENGQIQAENLMTSFDHLKVLFEGEAMARLDRELEHLKGMGLLQKESQKEEKNINMAPTPLGLQLYIRIHGIKQATVRFFDKKPETTPAPPRRPGLRPGIKGPV